MYREERDNFRICFDQGVCQRMTPAVPPGQVSIKFIPVLHPKAAGEHGQRNVMPNKFVMGKSGNLDLKLKVLLELKFQDCLFFVGK